MESIGRLAGGVAHDFNNMLSVILGYACLGILESDPTQPLHSYLTEIHTAAERSAGLTQKLLTFARKQTITPEVLDLNDTVGGMFKVLQRLIGENIFLNWQPAANLHHVKVDPTQIDQILVNLCANARDAISDTGKITIETEKVSIDKDYCSHHAGIVPGEYVRLVVSDDGCGMDLEMLPHIFEPFFTTKGIAEGTGLGLATVYGAVKLNNGFIYVDSEPGSGTTFSIYLPQHAGGAEQAKESAAETAPGGQETIMLVDDEQAILDMTTMFLTRQGYTVLQTNSPAEAIRLAAEHEGEISLLISDVIMPEMNGKELATNLLVPYPHLKCLFMSGYTANVIAHHGMLDKGVNFIQKPFSLPALANKVREILDTTCRSILEE
jgi:CheY-like chemotaxis protein